jgi:glyoxylase-like metal-dependent hydrolase (beta-lactamase superfamily II)
VRVAEGIYQVVLPLPFALRSVNCYLLRDGHGWAVVDAGLHLPEAEVVWGTAFAALGARLEHVTRIILTHAHPDHYGMAGWLQAQCRAPVLLSESERAFAQAQWHAGTPALLALGELFERHGMPRELMTTVAADVAALRQLTHPTPQETHLIAPGETLVIGERTWELLATPGHSDGHLALYCPDERLMLCGDAVLMRISPNVGRWPHSRPDPLGVFLETLRRLALLKVDLALPGHGPPITEFRARLHELEQHHAARLEAIEAALGAGATAFAVCAAVFPLHELSTHQMRFAMAETLAHLEYLVRNGRVVEKAGEPVWFRHAG